jgi:hypothetical protein
MLYAVEMEQTLGKARILQLYLDNAPWGGNLCGAEAAARRYFKRSARTLEPAQAVWMAAMLHKPQAVLEQWRRDGQIDAANASSAWPRASAASAGRSASCCSRAWPRRGSRRRRQHPEQCRRRHCSTKA